MLRLALRRQASLPPRAHRHRRLSSGAITAETVVVVSGLPRGNPPRALAHKLKELMGLRGAHPSRLKNPTPAVFLG